MNRNRKDHVGRAWMGLLALAAGACLATAAAPSWAADLPEVLPYGTLSLPASPTVRVNATQPRVVDLLGRRVANPHVPYRVQVQTELGACQLPAAAKFIREGLADPDATVRAAAARSAGQIGEPLMTADLKKVLTDPDPRVRREAVQSGAALGDASFVDAGLADSDASVIVAAVSVAGAGQAGKIAVAIASYPPGTQIEALRTFGRLADAKYADVAAGFLTGTVPHRAAAVAALGQMKATARSADAVKLLSDEHPTVRREALGAMPALISADDLHAKCITALADPDLSVRETAARLLQQSPSPEAIAALVSNLPSESDRLHDAARDALAAVGQPIIPTAEKMLADPDARRREDASYLLGQLKSDAGLTAHIALMKDADWRVVRQAAVSLGQIGRKEAIPEINAVVSRTKTIATEVPPAAAPDAMAAVEQSIVAAAMLGDASILPLCKSIIPQSKTVSPNLRGAAVYAVGRMGDRSDSSLGHLLTQPMASMEESIDVQAECVKAMGHLKMTAALSSVGRDRASAKFTGDAHIDWLCYWVRCRVLNQQIPLEPLPQPWDASTSVSPLGE